MPQRCERAVQTAHTCPLLRLGPPVAFIGFKNAPPPSLLSHAATCLHPNGGSCHCGCKGMCSLMNCRWASARSELGACPGSSCTEAEFLLSRDKTVIPVGNTWLWLSFHLLNTFLRSAVVYMWTAEVFSLVCDAFLNSSARSFTGSTTAVMDEAAIMGRSVFPQLRRAPRLSTGWLHGL